LHPASTLTSAQPASQARRPTPARHVRVLVVDDDESIRRLISMALFDAGYEVLSAANGAIALEHAREHAPDVVLLDMNMPIMDGWEFFRRYQEHAALEDEQPEHARRAHRASVIVMTAAASAQARAEQIGADDYLAKPFDLDDLYRTIERHHPGSPYRRSRSRAA
jgi:CheY-like chemotaxis protein